MWMKHYKLNEWEEKLRNMSNKDFDEYMCKTYTNMFKQRNQKGKIIIPMNFGFEIGPGWRHVLDSLCSKLKVIEEEFGFICVFDQIKEKFGSARFYYHLEMTEWRKEDEDTSNDKVVKDMIDVLVSHYEEYTDYVCEYLGTNISPDEKVKVGSWLYGMGIEGFKEWTINEHCKDAPETAQKRIKEAEKSIEREKIRSRINEALYYYGDKEINEVEDVMKRHESRRNKFYDIKQRKFSF